MTRRALVFALLLSACHRSAPPAPPAPPAAAVADSHGDESAQRSATRAVQVTVDGKPGAAWTPDRINGVAVIEVTNKNGEGRGGWSLKTLAQKLVAPSARVVTLYAGDHQRIEIPPAAWSDPSRTLVLRVTRRGDFKVHWAAADGNVGDAIMKGLDRVEIAQ